MLEYIYTFHMKPQFYRCFGGWIECFFFSFFLFCFVLFCFDNRFATVLNVIEELLPTANFRKRELGLKTCFIFSVTKVSEIFGKTGLCTGCGHSIMQSQLEKKACMSIMQLKLDGNFLRRKKPGKFLRRLIQTQLPPFDLRIIVDN